MGGLQLLAYLSPNFTSRINKTTITKNPPKQQEDYSDTKTSGEIAPSLHNVCAYIYIYFFVSDAVHFPQSHFPQKLEVLQHPYS